MEGRKKERENEKLNAFIYAGSKHETCACICAYACIVIHSYVSMHTYIILVKQAFRLGGKSQLIKRKI